MKRAPLVVVTVAATALGAVFARATFDAPLQAPLTFAGTLTGVAGPTADLAFVFDRGGTLCDGDAPDTPLDADGAFVARIALDETCPDDFFSGGDDPPVVSITVNGTTVVSGQPVGAVPYALFSDQARQAQHLGDPPCPAGYLENPNPADCRRAVDSDVVVKVGVGATAFWMDRYEAVVVDAQNQLINQGQLDGLDLTGRGATMSGFKAVSRSGLLPAENLTWLQANALCRAAGKRLPHRAEWLYAARSVVDGAACNISGSARRNTGGSACVSVEGVEDLFGNVQEFVEEWAVAPGVDVATSLDSGFSGDLLFNLTGEVNHTTSAASIVTPGMPAVEIRGGATGIGAGGGFLFGGADRSPTNQFALNGFRCVTPR